MLCAATQSAEGRASAARTSFLAGFTPRFFPEEAFERGAAHSVVKGDGDDVWPQLLDAIQNGTAERVYEGGRIDADRLPQSALGAAALGQIHDGVGADRPRLPEALLVLLGVAH